MSESGDSYVCSLTDLDTKYAGCSVRFEARISQSAGQVSSVWVSSGDVVFPRVKLEAPSASLANVNEALEVSYGPMNRPPLRKPAAGIGLFAVAFQLYDHLTLGVSRRTGTVIVYTIPFGLSA